MFGGREATRFDIFMETAEGTGNVLGLGHVVFDEARRAAVGDAQDVVHDKNLAVGVGSGADADDRYVQGFSNGTSQAGGYALEQDNRSAGFDQGAGIRKDRISLLSIAPLHLVAAQLMDGLGRQAQVGTHRYATAGQLAHAFGHPRFTLDLDDFGPRAHQGSGVVEHAFSGGITHERQVRHQHAGALGAGHTAGVVADVV